MGVRATRAYGDQYDPPASTAAMSTGFLGLFVSISSVAFSFRMLSPSIEAQHSVARQHVELSWTPTHSLSHHAHSVSLTLSLDHSPTRTHPCCNPIHALSPTHIDPTDPMLTVRGIMRAAGPSTILARGGSGRLQHAAGLRLRRALCTPPSRTEESLAVQAWNRYREAPPGQTTIFDKVISKEIPADIVHEDALCVAFRDIAPAAPHHTLVIPKSRVARLTDSTPDDTLLLGHLLQVAKQVAVADGLDATGYRIVINDGPDACQSVYHLHVHVIGGRPMAWPPG
eukprot:m.172986 g.172986  ORF g.172986 m.172986 type:complete len:284 (-) comp24302_c0_seq1:3030-3881(-)